MTVTFPHLGPLSLALAKFFSYMDVPYIIPLVHGDDALKKGAQISPEEMCIPFKLMVGNLMSAWEAGADTAVMIATCGPCRLGEYGQIMMEVLKKAGYEFQWVVLDSPSDIGCKAFVARFHSLTRVNRSGHLKLLYGIVQSARLIRKRDSLQRQVAEKAGYLEESYEAVRLLHETDDILQNCADFVECFKALKAAECRLSDLSIKKSAEPVKILVAGEIYTSIEKEGNRNMEELLMKLGCSVERHIDLSWWMNYSLEQALFPEKVRALWEKKNAIPCNVGGYGRETVQRILKDDGHDGVIKIMPAGCMPEIVTKSFCERDKRCNEQRILHLIYDEHSGTAGYETRIEAFVDMLERRKHVLAGN